MAFGCCFFVGISIYNLFYFHRRDWQAACIILLHVAWPQIVPSKSASDHLFFSFRVWTFGATFSGHLLARAFTTATTHDTNSAQRREAKAQFHQVRLGKQK